MTKLVVVSADTTEGPAVGTSKTDSDTVSQPIKRRRVLSDKQREALSKGREKRWLQRHEQKKGEIESEDMPPEPPTLTRESKSQYVYGENDDFSDDSQLSPPRPEPEEWSSSEDDKEFKEKLRQREIRRSIPKNIRKKIDAYLDQKLEESKQTKYLPPPISAREYERSHSHPSFTPLFL